MAPIGAEIGLKYESSRIVLPGQYLQTKTGRAYLVTASRGQQRGENVGLQHIRAIVVRPEDIEPGAEIHPLYWDSRRYADYVKA